VSVDLCETRRREPIQTKNLVAEENAYFSCREEREGFGGEEEMEKEPEGKRGVAKKKN